MSETKYSYMFNAITELTIEESSPEFVKLSGTFLKLENETANGRIYSINEAEEMTDLLAGAPVFLGVNPISGKHVRSEESLVGKITSVFFDRVNGLLRGIVRITNTVKFPDLISRVKNGWGLSVGGIATIGKKIGGYAKNGLPRMEIFGMRPTHLQLLEPKVRRGQDIAQVERVFPIGESYQFYVQESEETPESTPDSNVMIRALEEKIERLETNFSIMGKIVNAEPEKSTITGPSNPPKGSVVKLPSFNRKTPNGKTYADGNEAINDLYDRLEKGDRGAEKDLNRLWELMAPTILRSPVDFAITGCPQCSTGLTKGTETCPECGWNVRKSGYLKDGEIW